MPLLCNLHAIGVEQGRTRRSGGRDDGGGWGECSRMEQVYRDVTLAAGAACELIRSFARALAHTHGDMVVVVQM